MSGKGHPFPDAGQDVVGTKSEQSVAYSSHHLETMKKIKLNLVRNTMPNSVTIDRLGWSYCKTDRGRTQNPITDRTPIQSQPRCRQNFHIAWHKTGRSFARIAMVLCKGYGVRVRMESGETDTHVSGDTVLGEDRSVSGVWTTGPGSQWCRLAVGGTELVF